MEQSDWPNLSQLKAGDKLTTPLGEATVIDPRPSDNGTILISFGPKRLDEYKPAEAVDSGINPPMTVGRLFQLLSSFPPETRIFVNGYEGGIDDPGFAVADVVLDHNQMIGCFGPHELKADVDDDDVEGHEVVKGIILPR